MHLAATIASIRRPLPESAADARTRAERLGGLQVDHTGTAFQRIWDTAAHTQVGNCGRSNVGQKARPRLVFHRVGSEALQDYVEATRHLTCKKLVTVLILYGETAVYLVQVNKTVRLGAANTTPNLTAVSVRSAQTAMYNSLNSPSFSQPTVIDPVDPPVTRVITDPTTIVMRDVKHTYDSPFAKKGDVVTVVVPAKLWGTSASHTMTIIECRGEVGYMLEVVR